MMRLLYLTFVVRLCVAASTSSATDPPITAVAYAPDGNSVVATSQSGLHVFGWPELDRQRTIQVEASNLHSLAFTPPGDFLAVGGGYPSEEGIVEVFSWPTGESVATFKRHNDSVLAVAWNVVDRSTIKRTDRGAISDKLLLSASLDRDIQLWDVSKSRSLVSFPGHSRGVSALSVLPDGKTLVSGGKDQSLRIWDLESGQLIRSLSQHTGPIHDLALRSASGGLPMVASAAADRTIRFWQPTIGRMVRYIRLESEPLSIAWLNDGSRIVAACVDGHVRVVDSDEVKVTQNVLAIEGWAYAIATHPRDGSVVVGGSDGQIRRLVLRTASN
jgi:WD40 repeat protein